MSSLLDGSYFASMILFRKKSVFLFLYECLLNKPVFSQNIYNKANRPDAVHG